MPPVHPSRAWRAPRAFAARALVAAAIAASLACGSSSFTSSSAPLDPTSGSFDATAGAPVVADRQRHTATVLEDGDVLIAGGSSAAAGGLVATGERFEGLSQDFAATGNLTTARAKHSATRLIDGTVLVAGGDGGAGALASAESFDPGGAGHGTFTPLASSLTAARYDHAAVQIHDAAGSVLFIGGIGAGGQPVGALDLYTPGSGFRAVGTLQVARSRCAAARISNGDVVVFGGYTDAAQTVPTSGIEVIDGSAFTTRSLRDGLHIPRAAMAIVGLGDGRIMVAGGIGLAGAIDSAEVYNPDREAIEGAALMTRARGTARGALLYDSRVLVVGDDATADLFDPTSGTFVVAKSFLVDARTGGHTVTPLARGGFPDVLIFGGTSNATGTAEVFDPTGP